MAGILPPPQCVNTIVINADGMIFFWYNAETVTKINYIEIYHIRKYHN